jgi:tripartite-type tricarboxylate transporter receptor subunit TctC
VLAKIHRETVRTLNDPKVKENLLNRGMEVVGSAPEAFAAFLKQESEASGRLIKSAGIKVE